MKKVKLVTHNDLDGVGCTIVANLMLRNKKIDVSYCTVENIEETLLDVISKIGEYKKVYITDLSVSKEFFTTVFTPEIVDKIELIDHHKTALDLNVYKNVIVEVSRDNVLMCGTKLFYERLKEDYEDIEELDCFVECVRQWDTWDWYKMNNPYPKDLSTLLSLKGISQFSKDIIYKIQNKKWIFNTQDITILECENKRIKSYLESKEKQLIPLENTTLGVVFAEQYVSELGNYLAELHPEYDAIAIVGPNAVSYRTVKDDFDVSLIAKRYGGGGHQKAAGHPINTIAKSNYIKEIFTTSK